MWKDLKGLLVKYALAGKVILASLLIVYSALLVSTLVKSEKVTAPSTPNVSGEVEVCPFPTRVNEETGESIYCLLNKESGVCGFYTKNDDGLTQYNMAFMKQVSIHEESTQCRLVYSATRVSEARSNLPTGELIDYLCSYPESHFELYVPVGSIEESKSIY